MNKLPDSKSFRNNWTIPENYFENLEQQILSRKGIKKKTFIIRPSMVAAAALLIISIGAFTPFYLKNQNNEQAEEIHFTSDWLESSDLNPVAYNSDLETYNSDLELNDEQLEEYLIRNTELIDLIDN